MTTEHIPLHQNIEQPKSTMASTPTLSILFILTSIIIPSFSCPIHQKHALLHFKSTLTATYNSKYSDKFVKLDSWNSTSDCCSWKRVNCSRTGSVTELHLSMVAIPPLYIDPVSISSEIMSPIFCIRSLELLDISWNHLEGEIPRDGFSNLTKLLHLDMNLNKFNGSIPSQLFQLTNLRYLDMSYNSLEGNLGPELGSFRKLTTLRLSSNRFQGPIPAQLFELVSLRDLDLSHNKLGGVLSPEVGNLTKLESLVLCFIGRLTNLTSLDMSSNQFTGPIPSSMQNLSKLESLGLNDNMLAGEIPTWLFKIRTLKELYIGGKGSNLIWNNTTKVDPRCSLQEISMPSCGISGQIPEWISSQKELKYLDLSGNKLEGRFPHWLAEMNNISLIILSDNNLSGRIPPSLFTSQMLGSLDLSGNKLEGRFPHWPAEMNISYNNLIGSIPPYLFISNSLEVVDLSRNNFSGELPENIGNATSIFYLAVSENHFSGLLPKSISNLTSLVLLDLSRNRFSGDSLPFLGADYVDLSNNDFSGKIPENFREETEILYLGGNKFTGSLPFGLTKLDNLRVLDLHNSIITENLQEILLQFSTSLEILILRNTSLNGYIPIDIYMCSSLRILDLSRNNLSGGIPRQMANLPIMNMSASSNPIFRSTGKFSILDEYRDSLQDLLVNWKKSSQRLGNSRIFVLLDLSGNSISGEIPASLGNLKALKQLNISHNKISGNIPSSLGNLVGIESLDVSHNELSGSIPKSLDHLGNLTVLDVSNNMLTGKIPRGRQMDTMDGLGFQNNSGLCGIQINIKCPEDIPSSEGRVEEEEDLSRMFWEGTWIGFPIGFFSTILIMGYLLNFIRLFKFW